MNCKHWRRNGETYEGVKYGSCWSDKFEDDSDGSINRDSTDDMVIYSDYEGYSASLKTGEKFGCIHFEIGDNK